MRVDVLEIDGKEVEVIHNLKMFNVDIFQLLSSFRASGKIQSEGEFEKYVCKIDPRFKCVMKNI